jgi:integrase
MPSCLHVTAQPMTVASVIRAYLVHAAIECVHCAEARADRERTFCLFCAKLGDVDVVALKRHHLTEFIESHPTWKSVSTRRAKANEIRAAFQWATDDERIDRNPFANVRYAEAERRPDLPDDALEAICRHASKQFEAAARFLRLTGCRLSELCAATWPDVDIERGIWTINQHKSRRYTGRPKVIALVPEAVSLLIDCALASATVSPLPPAAMQAILATNTAPIFTNTRGTPWNRRTLGQQLARLKKRHGIQSKASLHGIRHRAASAAIGAGASVKLIAEQLGHSSTVVTERYYYARTDDHIEAMKKAMQCGLRRDD